MAVTAAIALAGLGYAVYSGVKKAQAEKKAQQNKMPDYKVPQEEYDNLRLAEAFANEGMSAGANNAYIQNADRGLANTTDAALRGGADANAIGGAYDRYNQGITNLSIYDDQLRQNHLNTLMAQNARMGSFADKSYQLNQYAPWANRAQLYSSEINAANQGIAQGVGIATQAGAQFGKGLGGGSDMPNVQTGQQTSPQQLPTTSPNFSANAPQQQTMQEAQPFSGAANKYSAGEAYQPYYFPGVRDNVGAPSNNGWGWNGITPSQ